MSEIRLFLTTGEIISPVGIGLAAHIEGLMSGRSVLDLEGGIFQGRLPYEFREILKLTCAEKALRHHDPSTRLGITLCRGLIRRCVVPSNYGVIFGSSRGPTYELESAILAHSRGDRLHTHTSPITTVSALPAAIARELELSGLSLYLSAACSTSLHAIIQAAASIHIGLAEGIIAGGVEYANSEFTLSMLSAAKIYSSRSDFEFPCQPGGCERDGMILSEGAGAVLIESKPSSEMMGELVGWGAATECSTLTGISKDGGALISAITSALKIAQISPEEVDLIVGHGAGTMKGDAAELAAYNQIFSDGTPIVWHKWLFGHALGASSIISAILGMQHLLDGIAPPHPYLPIDDPRRYARRLNNRRYLLVTALGFGGNAAAIIVKNPALEIS